MYLGFLNNNVNVHFEKWDIDCQIVCLAGDDDDNFFGLIILIAVPGCVFSH